jgi:proteic killer suppression protein
MIESFRHKGLRKLYEDGETRFLPADEVGKIRRILSYLESAEKPQWGEGDRRKLDGCA